jgi:hypothetical protein
VPRPHTTMRKIRDVLRLRLGDRLSLRPVSIVPGEGLADGDRRRASCPDAGITSWPLPVVKSVCWLFQYSDQIHDPIRDLNGQR